VGGVIGDDGSGICAGLINGGIVIVILVAAAARERVANGPGTDGVWDSSLASGSSEVARGFLLPDQTAVVNVFKKSGRRPGRASTLNATKS